jgi:hypothetical protein
VGGCFGVVHLATLLNATPWINQKSLGIGPRELVDDFLGASEKFFQAASSWNPGTQEHNCFNQRLGEVFLTCETPNP